MTSTKNTVAYILQGIGILIIIISFFRAISAAQWIDGPPAFEIFLQGVISGALFLGFGEAIKLMQGLFNQREPEGAVKEPRLFGGDYRSSPDSDRTISESSRQQLTEFYGRQNLKFDRVEPTPYEGYVIVYRNGGQEIVDLTGFRPEILTDAEVKRHPDLKNL